MPPGREAWGQGTVIFANLCPGGTTHIWGPSTTSQWGTTTLYGSNTTWVLEQEEDYSLTSSIMGLNPGTTYHFRGAAETDPGTGYGSDQSFTTLPV